MDIATQLRRDEGVKPFPYVDTAGKTTIGVGRNLTDDGMSDAEISFFLANDIEATTIQLQTRLPWFEAVDIVRQAVLVNMAFNMGFAKLEGFTEMLRAAAQGQWMIAADEMLNSNWARQVGGRADRLAQQMRTGEWQ